MRNLPMRLVDDFSAHRLLKRYNPLMRPWKTSEENNDPDATTKTNSKGKIVARSASDLITFLPDGSICVAGTKLDGKD